MNHNCPECGDLLPPKAVKCKCGWVRFNKLAAPKPDDRCAWSEAGIRCGQAGTITGNRGEGGPWYCAKHFLKGAGRKGSREAGLRAVMDLHGILYRKPVTNGPDDEDSPPF